MTRKHVKVYTSAAITHRAMALTAQSIRMQASHHAFKKLRLRYMPDGPQPRTPYAVAMKRLQAGGRK